MRFLVRLKDIKTGTCLKAEVIEKSSSIDVIRDYNYDPIKQELIITKMENARAEASEL